MKPMQAMEITQRVASSYPTNSEEYIALAIAAGFIGGLHMSGQLEGIVDADGHLPIPGTLKHALDHGPGSIDPTADPG